MRSVPSRPRICSCPLQHPRLTCAHKLSEDVKKDALFIIIIWDPGAAGALVSRSSATAVGDDRSIRLLLCSAGSA